MLENDSGICAPEDAEWAELTSDLLASPEGGIWPEMCERFKPYKDDPSVEMTETLRAGVGRGKMKEKTRAIYNDELLGFYSVKKVVAQISNRGERVLGVAERFGFSRPEPGLMLSSIVRSQVTEGGFGRVLLEDVVGAALADKKVRAIFVEPANARVAKMWRDDYHFEPVANSDIPDLLYMPVAVDPEEELEAAA
jgi:hypothetical protein